MVRAVVQIFDEEYVVKGGSSVEEIERIAEYVDRRMRQVAGRNPRLSRADVAVLAALNITEELFKLKEEYREMVQMLEEGEKKGDAAER